MRYVHALMYLAMAVLFLLVQRTVKDLTTVESAVMIIGAGIWCAHAAACWNRVSLITECILRVLTGIFAAVAAVVDEGPGRIVWIFASALFLFNGYGRWTLHKRNQEISLTRGEKEQEEES